MPQYEHDVVDVEGTEDAVRTEIQARELEGWELCSTTMAMDGLSLFFKRQLPPQYEYHCEQMAPFNGLSNALQQWIINGWEIQFTEQASKSHNIIFHMRREL